MTRDGEGILTVASFAVRVKNWVSTGPSCRDQRVECETREKVHNGRRSYIRRARKLVRKKMQREGLLPMKPRAPILFLYLVHLITRNSFGLMTRKLSVTESQRSAQFRGTFSRRKLSVASANWAHVA